MGRANAMVGTERYRPRSLQADSRAQGNRCFNVRRAPCRTVPSVRRLRTTRDGGCRAVAPERANAIAFDQEMAASNQQLVFGRPGRRAALVAALDETDRSRRCVGR